MTEVIYVIRVYKVTKKGVEEYKLYPTNSEKSMEGLLRTAIAATPDFVEITITRKVTELFAQTNREVT